MTKKNVLVSLLITTGILSAYLLFSNNVYAGDDPRTGNTVVQHGGNAVIGSGTLNLDSAGTAQQFPTAETKRVVVQAHPNNTNDIVIGSSSVVGAIATRSGIGLSAGQALTFYVSNLNQLYFDGVTTGDDVLYYYEN